MPVPFLRGLIAIAIVVAAACTADIHGNTVNVSADVRMTANTDVNNVQPGQPVALSLQVDNATLVAPEQPVPSGVVNAMFVKIFLDDVTATALVSTASTSIAVTIPHDTKGGSHRLICQLFLHDGTATTATSEITINVQASVSVNPPDA
jgi:hypothetical protein